MRRALLVLILSCALPAFAAAQSSHEKSRSSARKKSSSHGSSSGSSESESDSGWGSCLAGLCELGVEAAASSNGAEDAPDEPDGPRYLPPEGFDVAPLEPPPPPPPGPPLPAEALGPGSTQLLDDRPSAVELDARLAGAFLLSEFPSGAASVVARVEGRRSGPGLELWYTGLLEKLPSGWDQLPLGGARFTLRFGNDDLSCRVHVGAAALGLGPGEIEPALDPGLALETQLGSGGAPWLDLSASLLVFRGFVAPDGSAGLSFRFDPVYVRGAWGFLWLEGAYTGPSVALGVHH